MIQVFLYTQSQTGNKVFTGAEMVNFSTISLSTPGGQSWLTDRLATPGYFSVTNGATYSNSSDAYNINGYVKKYGNQAYTFPVGNGVDLRTLRISAPTAATDSYATAWILGDPSGNLDPTGPNGGPHDVTSVTFPVYAVSRVGQWDWQAGVDMGTTGDGINLTITVSIPDMTVFSLASNLRLVGWNGTSWIDLSGMPTATGNTENSTLFGYMQAGISAVAIGSAWWVLPVKLVSFTAQEKACSAELNWSTADEESFDHFEIERSGNAISFQKISTVNAKGNKTENNYSYTINQDVPESYYRLKMVNKDGSLTYSPVKYVKINCKPNTRFIKLYPNPVNNGNVFLSFGSEISGVAQIVLFNEAGQQVTKTKTTLTNGNNNIIIDVSHLPKGIYFIHLITADHKSLFQPQKIIRE